MVLLLVRSGKRGILFIYFPKNCKESVHLRKNRCHPGKFGV